MGYSGGLSTVAVVLIVTGVILGICILCALIFIITCLCTKKGKKSTIEKKTDYSPEIGGDPTTSNSHNISKVIDPEQEVVLNLDLKDYTNFADKQVHHHISPEKLSRLIKAICTRRTPPSTFTDRKTGKLRFTEVNQYATDDQITIAEPKTIEDADQDTPQDTAARVLIQMLRNGPRSFPIKEDHLCEILTQATQVFAEEPSLIEVGLPCVVYGDIHGQFSDLFRWFNLNGWPYKARSLFLGDFVDRGSHGVDVMVMVATLKVVFPKAIYIIRGNHEEELLNKSYSFFDEVKSRFRESTYSYFHKMFSQMPLAALINRRILAVHGGISPLLKTLNDIRNIKRPIPTFEVGSLACDLVWSDPDQKPNAKGFRPNLDREPQMGIGQHYGPDTVKKACKALNVEMIIRGHQAPLHGYAFFADNRLLTLFSAPGYKGVDQSSVNMGASLEINVAMEIKINQIVVSETYRKNRIENEKVYQRSIRLGKLFDKSGSAESSDNSSIRSESRKLTSGKSSQRSKE